MRFVKLLACGISLTLALLSLFVKCAPSSGGDSSTKIINDEYQEARPQLGSKQPQVSPGRIGAAREKKEKPDPVIETTGLQEPQSQQQQQQLKVPSSSEIINEKEHQRDDNPTNSAAILHTQASESSRAPLSSATARHLSHVTTYAVLPFIPAGLDVLTNGSIQRRAANAFGQVRQALVPLLATLKSALVRMSSIYRLLGIETTTLSPDDSNLHLQRKAGNNVENSSSAQLTSTELASNSTQPSKKNILKRAQSFIVQNLVQNKIGAMQTVVEYAMGWLERSTENLHYFPRLHPQECVKRTICEAHAEPEKYGALGLTLRMLFPATSVRSTDVQDNMEYKVINKYRYAAGYGAARRSELQSAAAAATSSLASNQNEANTTTKDASAWRTNAEHFSVDSGSRQSPSGACKEKYEDCLVSLLDVAQNLVDTFLRAKS